MSDGVVNNEARHRYEVTVDGVTAYAMYRLAPGVITFFHTVVPDALGGRGIGSKLVVAALGASRAAGLKVRPECPFFAAYIRKHPAYRDMVATNFSL